MEDYQGNAKKSKEPKPREAVERIVNTEVLVQKKSLNRKFKDLFIKADFSSVIRYVIYDVIIPATINTIVDASQKGVERVFYGESGMRRRNFGAGPRITYNNPIRREYTQSPLSRPQAIAAPRVTQQRFKDDLIFSSREEAALVLERMNDIIDQYEVVSIADLNQMVGLPTSHTDNKWGWGFLPDIQVRQIREGFMIDLPPAEPIQ